MPDAATSRKRTGADSRERKWHVCRRRCPRRLHFAAARVQAREADRPEPDRHRPFAGRKTGAESRSPTRREAPAAQRNGLQVLDVPPQRHFVVGPAVEIFEQEVRQPRLGKRAIVADICSASAQALCRVSFTSPVSPVVIAACNRRRERFQRLYVTPEGAPPARGQPGPGPLPPVGGGLAKRHVTRIGHRREMFRHDRVARAGNGPEQRELGLPSLGKHRGDLQPRREDAILRSKPVGTSTIRRPFRERTPVAKASFQAMPMSTPAQPSINGVM